jgi:hypothetical protein
MMISMCPETVTEAIHDWRCGSCGSRLRLLGRYTHLGGVQFKKPARTECRGELYAIIDLAGGVIAVHCGSCHLWRELRYQHETRSVVEGPWTGPVPSACRRGG